ADIRQTTTTVTVWTFPWSQLALAVILVALVLTVRFITRRRRQRLAQLLARARDEGRAERRGADLDASRAGQTG
ncbi:DUF916 domain-containing protein, partial [Micromonospora craterilacus]